jgi:hypothetical protein
MILAVSRELAIRAGIWRGVHVYLILGHMCAKFGGDRRRDGGEGVHGVEECGTKYEAV